MADVQLEHGFTKIANELLEAIQSFRFTQNQFKLLLALWRNTYGWNKIECDFSISNIVRQTGLQRTRVIETLKSLEENKVIIEVQAPIGTKPRIVKFNKNYAEWTIKTYKGMDVRGTQNDAPNEAKEVPRGTQNDTSRVPQTDTPSTKNTIPRGTQSGTGGVLKTAPPRGTQNDTSRVPHDGTPLNTKDNIKTININTEAADMKNQNENLEEDYKRKLLSRFIELRGHGFYPKPADVSAADEIYKSGVSLEVAISTMEKVFGNYNPRHSLDRINSLRYCAAAILDQHYENKTKASVIPVYEEAKPNEKRDEQDTGEFGNVSLFR